MTLKQRIDKILEHNPLGAITPTDLELKLSLGQGAITTPLREGATKFGPKVSKALHEKARVRHEFLQTGKGPIFEEPEKTADLRETFYRELIENNPEYSLLPKAVLRDYKMVPEKIIDMIFQNNDELKTALVSRYELIIEGLKQEVNDLRNRLGGAEGAS